MVATTIERRGARPGEKRGDHSVVSMARNRIGELGTEGAVIGQRLSVGDGKEGLLHMDALASAKATVAYMEAIINHDLHWENPLHDAIVRLSREIVSCCDRWDAAEAAKRESEMTAAAIDLRRTADSLRAALAELGHTQSEPLEAA